MRDRLFATLAPELEVRGFEPIPITLPSRSDPDAGKRPAIPDWQHPRPVSAYLPRYATCGVGALTQRTPAVDIDVRDAELADELHRLTVRLVGDGPVRYGAAPKRLIVCRAVDLFAKIATAGYALPNDAPTDKAHKLEILANGQQFVAYGTHPGTGRPYTWPDWSLLDLEHQDLPLIDAASATRGCVEVSAAVYAKPPMKPGTLPT